jgi:uncharacterized protein
MKLPIPQAALAQHLIALGKTGAGKSSKMRLIVEALLDDRKPVTIIDPKGDWWGIKSSADGKKAGFPVVIFGGEHADVPLNAHTGAQVAELVATGNRPSLIDLGGWMVGERTRFFIDFASSLFRHTRGARYLVIDEVHNFAPQGKVLDVDAGKCLHWANRLASEGRGKGVTLIAASQRPQKVHKDFLTSCETLVAGRVIHKLDRDAIKDWIDGCADPEKGKQVLAELATMQRSEAWVWSPEIEFGPARIAFPMFKTYDSFRPQEHRAGPLEGWAEVNLEEVKSKLGAVIQEAKANDPSELKKRIAELEKDLRKRPATGPSKEWLAEFEAAHARDTTAAFECGRDTVLQKAGVRVARLQAELSELAHLIAKEEPAPSFPLRAIVRAANLVKPAPAPTPVRQKPLNGLPGPQQRILDAIAWWNVVGVEQPSRVQVAMAAKYSPSGGAFTNPLGAARSSGLIDYPNPGSVSLTPEGRKLAMQPRDVPDTQELHSRVMSILDGPRQRILKPLLDAYPGEMSREELAAAANYEPVGGAFTNPLGSLRTLGLIDYPQPGRVVARPILFI